MLNETSIGSNLEMLESLTQINSINILGKAKTIIGIGLVEYPMHIITINSYQGDLFYKKVKEVTVLLLKQANENKSSFKIQTKKVERIKSKWELEVAKIENDEKFHYEVVQKSISYSNEEVIPWEGYTMEDVTWASKDSGTIPADTKTVGYSYEIDVFEPFYGYFIKYWFHDILKDLKQLHHLINSSPWPVNENVNIKRLGLLLYEKKICGNSADDIENIILGKSGAKLNWPPGRDGRAPNSLVVYFLKGILKPEAQIVDIILNSFTSSGSTGFNKASLKSTVANVRDYKNKWIKPIIDEILKESNS